MLNYVPRAYPVVTNSPACESYVVPAIGGHDTDDSSSGGKVMMVQNGLY